MTEIYAVALWARQQWPLQGTDIDDYTAPMPQVKKLIREIAPTQTQPYPPSGGWSRVAAVASFASFGVLPVLACTFDFAALESRGDFISSSQESADTGELMVNCFAHFNERKTDARRSTRIYAASMSPSTET